MSNIFLSFHNDAFCYAEGMRKRDKVRQKQKQRRRERKRARERRPFRRGEKEIEGATIATKASRMGVRTFAFEGKTPRK